MPSAKTIKARNKKYYQSNYESIRSWKRDNYKIIPPQKWMPREQNWMRFKCPTNSDGQMLPVRLGTYTGKVPIYISLKACNGTMFFLPLPLNKTLDTLHQANFSGKGVSALPDPELYIIVNGKPTKSKIVWYSLVIMAMLYTHSIGNQP